jgi:hypothetical protein
MILTKEEQSIAKAITKKRQQVNVHNSVHDYRCTNEDGIELEGYGAELAFCKMFNIYPDMTTESRSGGIDCKYKDFTVDVKWSNTGYIIVPAHKKVCEVDIYVLMSGHFPSYEFEGFVTADILQSPKNMGDPFHKGNCWSMKREDLEINL